MYYLLAGPLYRKLVSEFDVRLKQTQAHEQAREPSAEWTREEKLKREPKQELVIEELKQELNQLQRLVNEQASHLRRLNEQGLTQLMDHYHRDQLWSAATVASTLADIQAGMEFDTVAKRHGVPTDVIIIWAGYFQSAAIKNEMKAEIKLEIKPEIKPEPKPNSLDFSVDENALQLCERQLEYNGKVYREREDLARLELERLQRELAALANRDDLSTAGA
jgi:hypothetical protein